MQSPESLVKLTATAIIENLTPATREILYNELHELLRGSITELQCPDYILLRVGYTERLLNKARIRALYEAMSDLQLYDDELQIISLSMWHDLEQTVEYGDHVRVYSPSREEISTFTDHPDRVSVMTALLEWQQSKLLAKMNIDDCCLIKIPEHHDLYLYTAKYFIEALSIPEPHCGGLQPTPMSAKEFIVPVAGKPRVFHYYYYDTESG